MNKDIQKKKIFVAAALPYANGSLHLGHASALIGADILARYHRLAGNDVLYVSGSDCHGTPIAVEADRQGIAPSEIANKYDKEFRETLIDRLHFSYDFFTKTTSEVHKETVQGIFLKLYNDGEIYTKTVELPYCPKCARFLPDRYIEGECPICHYNNARGDQCDECGNLLDPIQLINPRCKICNSTPEWKSSEHFFFKLSVFQDQLKDWVKNSKGWRANAKNFTLQLIENPIPDRAITRDTEWGIPIPLPGYETKRIYVWFEAVAGYLSGSKEYSKNIGQPDLWKDYWQNEQSIHYYVHGKDNIPFHTIIWPAELISYGHLHLPDIIVSSEYLTLEKKQFSKSRHWAVWLPDFLAQFDAETLRYYLIANGPETSDADFSWSEFGSRVNTELIATFGNFVHRVLTITKNNFPEGISFPESLNESQTEFLDLAQQTFADAGSDIEKANFRKALKAIFDLVSHGNRFLNQTEPWFKVKSDKEAAKNDLAVCLQVIRSLSLLVQPFLPIAAKKIQSMLGTKDEGWEYPEPKQIDIKTAEPLYKRIEQSEIDEQLEKLKG